MNCEYGGCFCRVIDTLHPNRRGLSLQAATRVSFTVCYEFSSIILNNGGNGFESGNHYPGAAVHSVALRLSACRFAISRSGSARRPDQDQRRSRISRRARYQSSDRPRDQPTQATIPDPGRKGSKDSNVKPLDSIKSRRAEN
jgi:hypothetical protein